MRKNSVIKKMIIRRLFPALLAGAVCLSAIPLTAFAEPQDGSGEELLQDAPLDVEVTGEASEYGFIDPGYRFAYPDEELIEKESGEEQPDGLLQSPQSAPLNEAAPPAFSLVNISSYFPELADHAFVTPQSDQVTGVRNQGSNGLCWVFAPVAAIESGLIKSGEGDADSLDLSELQAAYYGQFRNETSNPAGCEGDLSSLRSVSNFGTTGGNDLIFITSTSRLVGVADESDVPYSMINSGLSPELTGGALATSVNKYLLKNARILYGSDNDKIKRLLIQYGAVSCWINYASSYYNTETNALYYTGDSESTNHEGAVVGWDDNYPKEYFRSDREQPLADGAWLIKNSWGTTSDRYGYYWVSYEDVAFNGGNLFSFDMIPVNDGYDRVYQHDGGIENRFMSQNGRNVLYMGNIFTAVNDSELKAVSFYTREEGIEYEISVYKNVTDTPVSGERTVSEATTGSFEYAGYHTVALNEPVRLLRDEKFSVVVKVTNPVEGSTVTLVRETTLVNNANLYNSSVYSEKGESFYSFTGERWTDMSATSASGNLRLKAFADDDVYVEVEAADENGAPLSGVTFELTDADGQVIKTFTDEAFDIRLDDEALASYLPESEGTTKLYLAETVVPRAYESGEGSPYTLVITKLSDNGYSMTIGGSRSLTVTHERKPAPLTSMRLSGKNRYVTASLIAAEAFPEGADEIILVTGEKFPDALAASAYAGAKNCPLLITKLKTLSSPVKELLKTTWGGRVKKVTFVGAGFDAAVKAALRDECGVTVIDDTTFAGKNRYDTADKVCQKGLDEGLFDTDGGCVVVTGQAPADALAMSPWSYYYKMPVLLVKSGSFKTAASKKLAGKFASIYVGGAEAVVNTKTLSGLKGTVIRLAGNNRYETAAEIADFFVPPSDGTDGSPVHEETFNRTIAFAPGPDDNYPDALIGGMLEGHLRADDGLPGPILLVPLKGMKSVITDYLTHYEASYEEPLKVYFLGAAPVSSEETIMAQLKDQAIDK